MISVLGPALFLVAVVTYVIAVVVSIVAQNRYLKAFRAERMTLQALHDQIEAQLERAVRMGLLRPPRN